MSWLVRVSLACAWLWSLAAVWLGGVGPDSSVAVRGLALLAALGVTGVGAYKERLSLAAAAVVGCVVVWFGGLQASHDREWTEDQSRLPHVELDGDRLFVRDLRTFRYRSPTDWDARWTDRTWDLSAIEGVDFAVERFTENEAVAHTLVSFRFRDDEPLAISVEIRKERGESYGPIRGLFRQYELMYVLGDERDLLELRAVHRDDELFLHPVRATPDQARAFLESLMDGVAAVEERPAFYNTVSASCTSVLARHFEALFDTELDHRIYLPGYSDALAHERGLIDTTVDFAATRAANRINDRARRAAGTAEFSSAIRRGRTDLRE